jgi:AcrR family transcriptional regulator
MTTEPASGGGRIARRRRSVQDRLALAAATLFTRQGYEATTVEQIAAEADVALRSFYRYATSKAGAIGPSIERNLFLILQELARTPLGVGLRAAVLQAVKHAVGDSQDSFGRFLATTLLTIPELTPQWLEANHRLQQGLVAELPRHFLIEEGLEAEMVAAVVIAAVSTAVERTIRSGGSIDELLAQTLMYVPDSRARASIPA